jgi:cytochrome c oxidase assembly factor CtaG
MIHAAAVPLSWSVAAGALTVDVVSLTPIVALAGGYGFAYRRSTVGSPWCFGVGLAIWMLATGSVIAVYSPVLFWMRALQVLLLMFVTPLFLAAGRPVSTARDAFTEAGRQRLDRVLRSRPAGVLFSPVTTSLAMLGTPWLLYLTPWYVASMTGEVGALTRVLLVLIGLGYFYTRLQADPVPRRFSPLLSIGISVVETLGDGLLGLVLWLGPVIAHDYYTALNRTWGPSLRTDQSVGAGVLWILGDVLGLPFLLMLMRALRVHEMSRAREVDRELDQQPEPSQAGAPATNTLWWVSDPQLRERFGR